ncbi:hypothetical protein [Helicobacter sp. MIT 05-5294]|uniref:hypothetical protein n=1 Tax=Helicobacter sp. MIT 05-5294 TaxID=1548150 RepID=UPI0010FEE298|nr:hypothetical protein [Helicobacter sp. MIT 05-5294]TLD85478.1 hypothetical protein LS69_009265 [Helicobacter sp. MIT 05-5294]
MRRIAIILLLPFVFVGVANLISIYLWQYLWNPSSILWKYLWEYSFLGFNSISINLLFFAILLITLERIYFKTKSAITLIAYILAVVLSIVFFSINIRLVGGFFDYDSNILDALKHEIGILKRMLSLENIILYYGIK